jgi:hypothetical protein
MGAPLNHKNREGRRIVQLRQLQPKSATRVLTVPSEVISLIEQDYGDLWFAPELTDEGILFRISDGPAPQVKPQAEGIPAWAKKGGAS